MKQPFRRRISRPCTEAVEGKPSEPKAWRPSAEFVIVVAGLAAAYIFGRDGLVDLLRVLTS